MKNAIKICLAASVLICLGAGCLQANPAVPSTTPSAPAVQAPAPVQDAAGAPPPSPAPPANVPALMAPIDGAVGRVTKKPFGLKISPKDSPVSPERFSGYHTGVDFETTADEQAVDVPISAACDGVLALKETATGYGGVAVQRCRLDGNDVTVIYGHLRLTSVTASVGQTLKAGDRIGVLGTGYSRETDGERRHLHFAVHRGAAIDIKGYVRSGGELSAWIDAMTLLR